MKFLIKYSYGRKKTAGFGVMPPFKNLTFIPSLFFSWSILPRGYQCYFYSFQRSNFVVLSILSPVLLPLLSLILLDLYCFLLFSLGLIKFFFWLTEKKLFFFSNMCFYKPVIFNLSCTLWSPGKLSDAGVPSPEILTWLVWGVAWASKASQVILLCNQGWEPQI